MNKIDPDDEEEDEEGSRGGSVNTTPSKQRIPPGGFRTPQSNHRQTRANNLANEYESGVGGAAVSYHQPHQQAYLQQQQQMMQQHQQQQQKPFIPQLTRRKPQQQEAHGGYGDNMVLDPSTGMMVQQGQGHEDDVSVNEDDIVCLSGGGGQSASYRRHDQSDTNYGTQVCV